MRRVFRGSPWKTMVNVFAIKCFVMQYREQIRTEIDVALANAEPGWCASALRQIVDLFVRGAPAYTPEHVALYDTALIMLAARADQDGLIDISNKLAPVENAPVSTVT